MAGVSLLKSHLASPKLYENPPVKDLGKYFDYNATSPLCLSAKEEWINVSDQFWHNPSSLYREAGAASLKLEDLREALADILGCGDEPERVIFTSGATESNNAVARYLAKSRKDGVIGISAVEHPSVKESVRFAFPEERCFEISVDRETGAIEPDAIIEKELNFVSIMAANNETGTLQDWETIGDLCRKNGILFHCDAAQWIGKMPSAELAQHCDFVTGSAHKFGGPKGVGFLVFPEGERASDLHSQIGGPQESGHRAGTENLAGISAMVTALEEKPDNWLAENRERWAAERDAFEEQIANMSGFEAIGKDGPRLWNTSMFILPHTKNLKWLTRLSQRGFAVSTGSACSAGKGNPSEVMLAMGLDFEKMSRVIRVSGGWETKEEDWMTLANAIQEVGDELLLKETR